MCGICGIIEKTKEHVNPDDIKSMMTVIKHRGPDDEGLFVSGNVGLGHVRLSIIDLSSAGHQPLFDASGRFCILHNGEVYNYIELKNELLPKYRFLSQTDTEVVLYAYLEWGRDCLERFNGMFAFAIYDTLSAELFLARDRFGIKPLYYLHDNNRFIFASEIRSILQVAPDQTIINDAAIFDYLVYNRTDQYTDTFYKKIKRLEHGHFITIKNNEVSSHKWYNLPDRIGDAYQSDVDFRDILADAVKLRLRSDVPVGVCLSGGLDSSCITSVLTNWLGKNDLQTFSAVYRKGEIGDESDFIDLYAQSVFRMHKTYPTPVTLYNDISQFVVCMGEPVPSTSPYAQFKVMELAKGNVKVLLDGQGGDELLAGYHYFFGTYLKHLLSCLQLLSFMRELSAYLVRHKSLFALQSLLFYVLPNCLKSRARLFGRNYLARDFYEQQKTHTTLPETLFNARTLQEALLFHFAYKLEHLLKWEDRNSMWFSLESRVPFLDYRLVERTLSLAPDRIIHDGETKYVLRQAMKGILPERIRTRQDKIGFATPESEWFRTPTFERYIFDLLDSDTFRQRPYFNRKNCADLYSAHLQRRINVSRDIWKWINLELWLRNLEYHKA